MTLTAIERVSHDLPEGAVTAKTVLRNPECKALYAAAAGIGTARRTRSGRRTLRAELATGAENGLPPDEPSAAELRRVGRLDRRSKRELAAMVIRLEREVEALHRHNANLREHLLRNGFGRSGRAEAGPTMAGPPTRSP